MDYIQGISRKQIILFPEAIDDYIKEDNPVQFIEAFVENLDLKELSFKNSSLKSTGRPPYDPSDMLKLYIYGYLNRIRSSRSLEKESRRNLEVIWLLKKLTPDFKTIADFRKNNTKAIKRVSKEFILLCKKIDLFSKELVAIDGSKFKASNSKKRNFNQKKLKRHLKEIDKKLNEYFDELDINDKKEAKITKPKLKEIKEKIKILKERKNKYQLLEKKLKESKDTQVSLTDPQSRLMKNNQKIEVCYNVQISVDKKHKLILDHEVVNKATDQNELYKMAKRAKDIFEVKKLEVVTDKGYYNTKDIKKCTDIGIIPYVPEPKNQKERPFFSKKEFTYIKEKDIFICPLGDTLTFKYARVDSKRKVKVYKGNRCKVCSSKAKCTKGSERAIIRYEYEDIIEEVRKRTNNNKEKLKLRNMLSEHPFGTIKHSFNQGYMLMRGLEKVRTEISLSVLAYNIKRAINIVGLKALIACLQ